MAVRAHAGAAPGFRPPQSALERCRALLSAYLERGTLSPRDAAEASSLLERAEARRLPARAGTPLQTALYLVRVGLIVLQLLAVGDAPAAERQLSDALLAGNSQATTVEPFDGLLFLVGQKVAHELGDAQTAASMAAGARRVAADREREADAVRSFLGMPGASGEPPDS